MNDYFEKMKEALDRQEQSRIRGLSTRDVVAQNYTEDELQQLIDNLRERPLRTEAAFRLHSFIYEQQQDRISEGLRRSAADAVADHVASPDQRIDASAATLFIVWGGNRADYKSICLGLLRHTNAEMRGTALSYAGWFLHPPDYPLLFEFRHDPDIAETSMGGPLRYVLRDRAQRVLRQLTNCPKPYDGDCFEETPSGRVSYSSWAAFLNWYESNKGSSVTV
jgi:hypothetical protein